MTKKLVVYVTPTEEGALIKIKPEHGEVTIAETTAVAAMLAESAMDQCGASFETVMEAIRMLIEKNK